jgi:hypothetical protein
MILTSEGLEFCGFIIYFRFGPQPWHGSSALEEHPSQP